MPEHEGVKSIIITGGTSVQVQTTGTLLYGYLHTGSVAASEIVFTDGDATANTILWDDTLPAMAHVADGRHVVLFDPPLSFTNGLFVDATAAAIGAYVLYI